MNRNLPASPCLRVAASLLLSLAAPALAQTPKPATPTPAAVASKLPAGPDLAAMVRSPDPAQQAQGLTQMRAELEKDGIKVGAERLRGWINALRDQKMTTQANELAEQAWPVFQDKDRVTTVRLLGYKALFLLEQGRKEDAIALMRQGVAVDPMLAAMTMDEQKWTDSLVLAQMSAEALELIDRGIFSRAEDVKLLEKLQTLRIQTLLAANKPYEALAATKSLYNVSSMANTANALRLVSKCLQAAYPEDRDLLIRFRDQQVTGAAPATTQPAAATPPTVLSQIKVNAALYEKPLGNNFLPLPTEEDFTKLTGMGNLLLLADRPLDAKLWFEQAYRVCNEKQLASATESIARALKAEDGAIGRANAFLLALRPTKPEAK